MQYAAVGSRPFDRRLEPPLFIMARVSTKFLLRPPYTRLWDRIPRVLWDTLADESFSPRQTHGERWSDVPAPWHGGGGEEAGRGAGSPLRPAPEISGIPVGQDDQVVPTDHFNGLVASAAGRLPQPLSAADLADLWDRLWFLAMATADGKPSENFSLLENEWDRQGQLRWFSRDDPPPLQQPELLKWRHWRPGKIREMEPTTQRALKLHMCGKWAERLLAHFAPFAEHRKEALDLLGDSRFRTLRQHCLVYESLRKRGFTVIPWQERHVRSLLNQLAEEEVTPFHTLKWFSKTFGLLKIDELHRLKSNKSSLEEALTDTVTRPQRKAVVPSKSGGGGRLRSPGCHRPRYAGGPGGADTRCWTLSS